MFMIDVGLYYDVLFKVYKFEQNPSLCDLYDNSNKNSIIRQFCLSPVL